MARNSVIKRGDYYQPEEESFLYEKTSADDEKVSSLGASKGTADHQFKIYAGGVPAGVFLNQYKHPGMLSSKYNKLYAHDAEPIDIATEGNFVFEGTLDDGQAITKGQAVQFETNTGKIQKQTSNPRCGYAVESKTASGADSVILVAWDPEHTIIETQTISSLTAHVATLSYTPIEIYHVEATAGSVTGPKAICINDTTPATTQVYWNGTTSLTFNGATDAVTAAKVRYRHT
jgi:hypothetical protein